jgi:hypothetical protein
VGTEFFKETTSQQYKDELVGIYQPKNKIGRKVKGVKSGLFP